MYGPQENQRVTSGSEASCEQRGGVAGLGRAQGQCRAYEGEHGASRFAAAMLGLLYDVHGNLPALEAVLEDAQAVQRRCAGSSAATTRCSAAGRRRRSRCCARCPTRPGSAATASAGPPRPSEAPDDPVVQGAIASAAAILGPRDVADLAALPESAAIGEATRAWHGSPVSDVRSFLPEPQAEDAELLAGVTEHRLVFGHTHLPFQRFADPPGVELVNPGSVGMPFDGNPRASWAVIDDDGAVEHRRVRYDHAASARRVRAIAGEDRWGEVVAQRIERAQFVVR